MTAATTVPVSGSDGAHQGDSRVATHPVTLPRVLHSEWIKFRSLRSSWAVLGGAVLAMVVIGMIVAFNTRHVTADQQPDDLGRAATLQGYYLGQLLIGALGVLYVSGEFSTGMIFSTLDAVPTRLPVLVAKSMIFLVISGVTMMASSLVAFLAGQALIGHYRTAFTLADHTSVRVVLGTGLYLALVGLLGGAIGWIVRSTPGSLVTFFALLLVLPVIFESLLGTWGKDVYKFLPSGAGSAFAASPAEPNTLHPLAGLIVVIGWVVAALAVAALTLRRRDA